MRTVIEFFDYDPYSWDSTIITERARIEAQIKTAEAAAKMRAEEESRQQREKEREAARAAIEKVLYLLYVFSVTWILYNYQNVFLILSFVDEKNRGYRT